MSEQDPKQVPLDDLRRSCATCSVQQLCLPAAVEPDDLARLDVLVRDRRPLARGESLYRQGDTMTALYVARDGAFKTVVTAADGQVQILGFHLAGELFGFDGFGTGRHQCDAEALAPAQVCEVPIGKLEEYAVEVPGLRRQLIQLLGRRMNRDQAHLEILGRRQASERVALFLHGLSERYQALGGRPDRVDLPMSREDIGSFLGLAFETVSRALGRLQEQGLITVEGRRVRLLDAAALRALVHPERG